MLIKQILSFTNFKFLKRHLDMQVRNFQNKSTNVEVYFNFICLQVCCLFRFPRSTGLQ